MQPTISSDLKVTDQHQSSDEDDLYSRLKSLQCQLEFIDIQEEYVRILSTINREHLKPSASVALHRHSNALVDVLPPEVDSSISLLSQSEKPDVTYNDIGGCDIQKQEIREAVELPLTHHDLYKQIGIDPPRGVLLYGPPGTGKTMLAKVVANHTTAAFIRVVGSEFVQKYLGEGPRMVCDVFRLAKENAPAIIFIDEVDAIATTRFDAQTGADREVQRILMELLNQVVPGRFYIEEQKYFCERKNKHFDCLNMQIYLNWDMQMHRLEYIYSLKKQAPKGSFF
ncbi:putative proteasome ATPase [Rosa chinensis]|uniref:Putative proteasome ATPase n=1 Tax=Rosa chinensis TaxID=74649 RepID=A0A2P6QAW6_ROSCH|nr:26S proteasome regulatory subunit 6B homolog [Rosa chinensis]PRQ31317.1 putative proteasome ATPase [Rosa chinensis]